MEFKNEHCTFTIPDRPTVRMQMRWFGATQGRAKEDYLVRYWEAAKVLIEKWDCAAMPDYTVDLDTLTDPTQTSVCIWAGLQVFQFMNELDDVPKN